MTFYFSTVPTTIGAIFKGSLIEPKDGKGTVVVVPDSVGTDENTSLEFSFDVTGNDTLAAVKISIPSYWGWTSSAADVSLSGEMASGQLTVNANDIIVDSFIQTSYQDASIRISNLTSPAVDTSSTFSVSTASPQGTLQKLSSSPVVQVGEGTAQAFISIEDAVQLPVGSNIVIKGVISIGAGVLRNDYTDGYVQDASGFGLNIFRFGSIDPDISRGNLVVMSGVLEEYNGKMEITDYSARILKTDEAVPGTAKMTTLNAYLEARRGSFLETQGVITEMSSNSGGINITIDDGTGPLVVRVWETTGVDLGGYGTGEYVVIRGVMDEYNDTPQLLLAYQEDIYLPQFDGSPTLLKVENRPFVPDRGEKIKIEFSVGSAESHYTLRIYDLGGRLITTLMDGTGLPVTIIKQWDGRDQLGQDVPLGTYICHLETVNTNNGKRDVKMAPIVVGTVLK